MRRVMNRILLAGTKPVPAAWPGVVNQPR